MAQTLYPQQSNVKLYKSTGIAPGVQTVFRTRENQTRWFNSKLVGDFNQVSVVRNTGTLKLAGVSFEDAMVIDYMSYYNPNFGNKRFYCYVTSCEYVNNNTVAIHYTVDHFQTYLFDFNINKSMQVREHLSNTEYAKAIQNPYRRDLIALQTPESISIAETEYTVSGRKQITENTEGSTVVPRDLNYSFGASGGLYMIHVRIAQFPEPDRITDSDVQEQRNQLEQIYNWSDRNERKIFGGGIINEFSQEDRWLGVTLQEGAKLATHIADWFDPAGRNEYLQAAQQVINNQKQQNKAVDAWLEFRTKYDIVVSSEHRDGIPQPYYTITLPANTYGHNKLKEVIDWLTKQGLSSSIIDIHVLPLALLKQTPVEDFSVYLAKKSRHPKLDRAPFSYIRTTSPNGDVKEHYFELFTNLNSNNEYYAKFKFKTAFDGVPLMAVIPVSYKTVVGTGGGSSDNTDISLNTNEMIIFDKFPQIPYVIDGWLTQLAGYTAQANEQRTFKNQMAFNQQATQRMQDAMFNTVSGAVTGGMAGAMGGPVGIAAGAVSGLALSGTELLKTHNQQAFERKLRAQELNAASHVTQTNDVASLHKPQGPSSLWAMGKPTYVASQYVGGSNTGFIPYHFHGVNFTIEVVTLTDTARLRYEEYFDTYGYASGRIGKPHVFNYIRGGDGPHWESVDGYTSTYVQTDNCTVTDIPRPAASEIENMFNSGMRVRKGD